MKWGVVALIVVGLALFVKSEVTLLRVASGSMEPTLPTNSFINVDEEAGYEVGDIITFHADDGDLTTHRLVEIADDSLVTKGDANPTPDVWDEPVVASDVVGKVVYMTPVTTLPFWGTPRGIGIIACMVIMLAAWFWRMDDEESNKNVTEARASAP